MIKKDAFDLKQTNNIQLCRMAHYLEYISHVDQDPKQIQKKKRKKCRKGKKNLGERKMFIKIIEPHKKVLLCLNKERHLTLSLLHSSIWKQATKFLLNKVPYGWKIDFYFNLKIKNLLKYKL